MNYKFLSYTLSVSMVVIYITIIFSLSSPISLGLLNIFSNIIIGSILLVVMEVAVAIFITSLVYTVLW